MNLTEVNVIELDVDKINKDLTKMAKDYFKDNNPNKDTSKSTFQIRGGGLCAVITGNGCKCVYDKELIGEILQENDFEVEIYEHKKLEEGKMTFGMMPILETTLSFDVLIEKYKKRDICVVEFMGNRYNYNDRIKSNQKEFIDLLNQRQ